jgi:hypothetical protein
MKVISDSQGFILVFDTTEDLEQHTANLQSMLEWVKKDNVQMPVLYSVSDENFKPEDIQIRNMKYKIGFSVASQAKVQKEQSG